MLTVWRLRAACATTRVSLALPSGRYRGRGGKSIFWPLRPPMLKPRLTLRITAKCSASSLRRYSVPPSASAKSRAASRIFSISLSVSRSEDRATPMALSISSRERISFSSASSRPSAGFTSTMAGLQARKPFVVGAFVHAFEQEGAEIALAGIRDHRQHNAAGRQFARDFQRRREGGTAGDTAEDAFLRRQLARGVARDHVVNEQDAVVDLAVDHRADEVGRPALDLVRLPLVAREQGRLRGFA